MIAPGTDFTAKIVDIFPTFNERELKPATLVETPT
jgi:hypothetical protein